MFELNYLRVAIRPYSTRSSMNRTVELTDYNEIGLKEAGR